MLGCAISASLTLILFIIVFRFTQPTCELIFVEPEQLRAAALESISKKAPIRSHDKSMLLKMAAYLEYNVQTTGRPILSELARGSPQPQPQVPAAQQSNQFLAANQQAQPTANQQNLAPNKPYFGQAPNPVQPTNPSPQANQTNTAGQQHRERRFLPLDFDDLEVKKVSEFRYKYKLTFNCTTMNLIFIRRPERVYVEQISLELKLASWHKTSCDLQLPAQGAFGVDTQHHLGMAHYYCDRPLHYSCYHYSSKNTTQSGTLLAELHIHSLEFEVGANNRTHKSHEFTSPRSECFADPSKAVGQL